MTTGTECYTDLIRRQCNNDHGFMGLTHAVSGLAAVSATLAFAPAYMIAALGTKSVPLVILAILCCTGATLLPDLDNTTSRAKNDWGVFGSAMSGLFRGSSSIVQTAVRTRRDDPDPNPHRGAWHTIPFAGLLAVIVWAGTNIGGSFTLGGLTMTGGTLFGWFFSAMLTLLTFSCISKKQVDNFRKSTAGEGIIIIFCFILSGALIFSSGSTDFRWLAVAVFAGMVIHIIGDCFTKAGCPVLFPLSGLIKGKFWWTTRFTSMSAGGSAEKYLVLPVFIAIALVCFYIFIFNHGSFTALPDATTSMKAVGIN